MTAKEGRFLWWASSGGFSHVRDFAPNCEGSLPGHAAAIRGRGFWIGNMKEVRDLVVDGQEPLHVTRRFEAFHNPLAPPRRLVGVLGPIVQPLVLAMLDPKVHLRFRGSVGSELVCDHHTWRRDRAFQKPLHKPQRRRGVPSPLDEDVENEAVLVDRAPEPVCFASDREDDFIHVPFVAASRRPPADLVGERLTEFLSPLAHGLIGHTDPTRSKHLLDHPQAQGEPEIQPDRMTDHLSRKTMTAIKSVGGGLHDGQIDDLRFQNR